MKDLRRIFYLSLALLLIATPGWPDSIQVSDQICPALLTQPVDPHLLESPSEQERLQAIDLLSQDVLVHYTDLQGLLNVLRMNRFVGDSKNNVYFSNEGFTAEEAEQYLFIGNQRHVGRGDFVIILQRQQGAKFTSHPQMPFELIHQGSYRFQAEQIMYVGPNPF